MIEMAKFLTIIYDIPPFFFCCSQNFFSITKNQVKQVNLSSKQYANVNCVCFVLQTENRVKWNARRLKFIDFIDHKISIDFNLDGHVNVLIGAFPFEMSMGNERQSIACLLNDFFPLFLTIQCDWNLCCYLKWNLQTYETVLRFSIARLSKAFRKHYKHERNSACIERT